PSTTLLPVVAYRRRVREGCVSFFSAEQARWGQRLCCQPQLVPRLLHREAPSLISKTARQSGESLRLNGGILLSMRLHIRTSMARNPTKRWLLLLMPRRRPGLQLLPANVESR